LANDPLAPIIEQHNRLSADEDEFDDDELFADDPVEDAAQEALVSAIDLLARLCG
jgi:hypothetical protein